MITRRDLDAIGPPPPQYRARARPPVPEVSLGSEAVSAAAVLTVSGPCPRPVLVDLAARVAALLATGVLELVLDLSAVTDADTRLLRALDAIHRRVDDAGGSLALTGEPPPRVAAALDAATLAQVFWIYRCARRPRAEPAPASRWGPGALSAGPGAA
jgi:ABC-type transporter Mla MlaB component